MTKPDLVEIFGTGGKYDDQIRLQYDTETSELYVNNKKIMTEINFSKSEKILACVVAISVAVQAIMSILTYFKG